MKWEYLGKAMIVNHIYIGKQIFDLKRGLPLADVQDFSLACPLSVFSWGNNSQKLRRLAERKVRRSNGM